MLPLTGRSSCEFQEKVQFETSNRRHLQTEPADCFKNHPNVLQWYAEHAAKCAAIEPENALPLSQNIQDVAVGDTNDCGLIKDSQIFPLYECVAGFPWTKFQDLVDDTSPECQHFVSMVAQSSDLNIVADSTNEVNKVCGIDMNSGSSVCEGLKMSPCRKAKSLCMWKSRKCILKPTRKPTQYPTARPTKAPTDFSCGILKALACKSKKFRSKCEWDGVVCAEKDGCTDCPHRICVRYPQSIGVQVEEIP